MIKIFAPTMYNPLKSSINGLSKTRCVHGIGNKDLFCGCWPSSQKLNTKNVVSNPDKLVLIDFCQLYNIHIS